MRRWLWPIVLHLSAARSANDLPGAADSPPEPRRNRPQSFVVSADRVIGRWFWPVLLVLSAAATDIVVFADAAPKARPYVALWFVLVCPGMALVRLLRLEDPVVELVAGVGLSVALATILATVTVEGGIFSWRWTLGGLIVLVCVAAVAQLWVRPGERER